MVEAWFQKTPQKMVFFDIKIGVGAQSERVISIELIKLVNFRPMLSNNFNFAFQIKLLRPQKKVDFFVIFVLFLPLQKTNEP